MKILTLLGFLVLLTISPMTNCFRGLFNAVPVPILVYYPKPVAGSNVGLLALAIFVFSILLRRSPTTPPTPICPLGYTLNENECGRFCYRLESQACRSFEMARAACKAEGADLLEPDVCTYPMFRDLAMQTTGECEKQFWIGGFRTPPAPNYLTVRGAGLPDNFQFWGANQPDRVVAAPGTEQACVQMDDRFNFLLNDDFCINAIGYICQKFL